MPVNKEAYFELLKELSPKNITIVAVSKTKPVADIFALYELGHRDFGENYVQELTEKAKQLPSDIRWHFIGHLQTNKVRFIVPLVQLIQGVDSLKLLKAIDKQAKTAGVSVDCLLQVHIAREETKFGMDEGELKEALEQSISMRNVNIQGLMGMATFTNNTALVKQEFERLKRLSDELQTKNYKLKTLSMGMTADYKIAVKSGSNMVRIGSLIFGERN